MAYAQTEYEFWSNPKVRAAGKDAAIMHIAGCGYCNQHLTDGFISDSAVGFVAYMAFQKSHAKALATLVEKRLWLRVEGGYMINDFLEHNKSKAQVEEFRQKKSTAGKASATARSKEHGLNISGTGVEQVLEQVFNYDDDAINKLKDTTTTPPCIPPKGDPKFEAFFFAYEKQFGRPPKVDSEEMGNIAEMVNDGISDVEFIAAIREMAEKDYSCPAISSARQWIMNNRMKAERKAKAKNRAPARETPDMGSYKVSTKSEVILE